MFLMYELRYVLPCETRHAKRKYAKYVKPLIVCVIPHSVNVNNWMSYV